MEWMRTPGCRALPPWPTTWPTTWPPPPCLWTTGSPMRCSISSSQGAEGEQRITISALNCSWHYGLNISFLRSSYLFLRPDMRAMFDYIGMESTILKSAFSFSSQQVYSIEYMVSTPIILLSTAYSLYSPFQTLSNIKYMSVLTIC